MRFIYYRTVRLSDTDAAGVIYFARLLSLCHEAYEASLETSGIQLRDSIENSSIAIPIAHCSADFLRPIFCNDKLAIHLSSQFLKQNEFEIDYTIYGQSTSLECLAKAKTRHVCIDLATRRRNPLSKPMIQWLVQPTYP
ncbi:MAG: acyl-CoA thioesterase [Hydrococcus sp. RU_2_2]|nr:acyl-CoA thioesterase [Hydrococcus sp. RU_2_2]NJP19074.1 acyl-CoA thioesterase [Hydrococcus sp. CRU_1_1]NJQ97942.1 acyl-CoA thioesterase [Hydrococcus sp. CSU_1_8]